MTLTTIDRAEFISGTSKGRVRQALTSAVNFSRNSLVVISLLFAVAIGILVPTSAAHAGFWDQCYDIATSSGRPLATANSGIEKMMSLNGNGKTPDSAYGIAGARLSWYSPEGDNYNDDARKGATTTANFGDDKDNAPNGECVSKLTAAGMGFSNAATNTIFMFGNFTYQLTAWVFQNAYSNNLSSTIMKVITKPIESLRDNLYLGALTVVLLIVGIWVAFKAFNFSFREGLGGAAWALGMVILMSALIFNPTLIPDTTSKMSSEFNSSILSVASSSNSISYCTQAGYTETSTQKNATVKPNKDSVAKGTCAMWSTFVFSPWSYAEFGKQPSDLKTLNGNAVPSDRNIITGGGESNWALYQFAVQTKTANDGDKGTNAQVASFANIVNAVYSGDDVDKSLWSGNDSTTRILASLLGVIAAIAGAFLIGDISLKVLIYGIIIPVMMFLLPLVGLVAPHPTFGKRVVIKYFGQIAGFFVKTIVLTLIMLLVLVVFMNVSSMTADGTISWWYSVFMIIIFSFAIKKIQAFLDSVTNFGGGENIVSRADRGIRQTASRLGLAGAGAVAGAAIGTVATSPLSRHGRQSIRDNRDAALANQGLDSTGHKKVDEKAQAFKEKERQKELKDAGLTEGEDGLLRDKDGKVDKRNWVKDDKGKIHAPNSRVAQGIKEREKKEADRQARRARNAATRKAVSHQMRASVRAGASEGANSAALGFVAGTSLSSGTRRMFQHTKTTAARARGSENRQNTKFQERSKRRADSKATPTDPSPKPNPMPKRPDPSPKPKKPKPPVPGKGR